MRGKSMLKRITALILIIGIFLSDISGSGITADAMINTDNLSCYKSSQQLDLVSADNNISVEGTSSFGTLLTEVLEDETYKQEQNNGCNIFSIEMVDNVAIVTFETTQYAALVVGIYNEEETEMLASGEVNVTSDEMKAHVEIEIDTMPEYFNVKGYLIDPKCMRPLCTVYENPDYTKEMQEFLAKTTADFEEGRVFNLDEDKTNNFAVYSENTIVISQISDSNDIIEKDESNNTYVIENCDSSITNLKHGDIFAYEYSDGDTLVVKVDSIAIDGSKAVIVGMDTSMEEVFDYVKIDTNLDTKDISVDETTCNEGVKYDGIVEVENEEDIPQAYTFDEETSVSLSNKFSFLDNKLYGNVKLTGDINFNVEVSLKVYISTSKQYIELKMDYKAKVDISVSGKTNPDEKGISLAKFTASPVPGVYITFTPALIVQVSEGLTLSGELLGTIGFSASIQNGIKNLTTAPKLKTEVKGEVTVFLGISMKPKVKVISDRITSAELEIKVGAEVKGKLAPFSTDQGVKSEDKEIHECKKCIDGDIIGEVEGKLEVRFFNLKKYTLNAEIKFSLKVDDFYYSFDYGDFALTTCPHYQYKTTYIVTDENKKPIEGAVIHVLWGAVKEFTMVQESGKQEKVTEIKTNSEGIAEGYLPGGEYSVLVNVPESYTYACRTFVIEDEAKCHLIKILSKGDGGFQEEGNIVINRGQTFCIGENHSGAITEDGSLYMWGENTCGQLGNGSKESQLTPVKVLDKVVSVSINCDVSGAITEDGSLYMWGANYDGTVGNGNIENQLTPVKVLDKVKSPVDLGVSTYNVSITNVDKSYPMQGMSTVGDLKVSEDGIGTVEFDYLVPNETYNFYIMKSREAEEVFGTSNLLYLIQAVADYSGRLSISYIFTEENQDGSEIVNDLFVVQMTQTDLSSAQVQIDNLQYTGDTQYVNPIVTLDNIVLTQGEDYELSSNYSAVDVGTYNVTISGIGLYTGIINVQYRVIGEGIVFGDANNDGTVDSKDAVLLKKYLAGFTDLEIDLLLCDVNADGAVDSRDAVRLMKKLAGYNVELGIK